TMTAIINVDKVCRLCMEEAKVLLPIFKEDFSYESVLLPHRIMAFAAIQMCPGDGLPNNICPKCVEQANTAYEFKEKCEASDSKLRAHLCKIQDLECVTVKSEPQWDCYDQCDTSSNTASIAEQYVEEADSHDLWDQNCAYFEPVVQCTVKEELVDNVDIGMTNDTNPTPQFKIESTDIKSEENVISNSSCGITESTTNRQNQTTEGDKNEIQFRHKCEVCPKAFKRKFQLTEHMCIHTGKLPYQCTHCSKSFARKFTLRDHVNLHLGIKPYSCTLCEKAFARKISLNVHIKTHTATKVFKCEICQKSFTKKVHVADHLRVHSGDQPYICTICGKAFTHKYSLTVHMRHHRGEKPYACHCGKAFSQQSHLTVHQRTHTGERPYQCYICNKAFNHNGHLKEHLKVHKVLQ
ncbi:hypothetical protein L798_10580, partial [Zootermopsis nevadensis]